MRNPAKFVQVDYKHAKALIDQTRGENNQTIDYKDLNIGADFMIKELYCETNKQKEIRKLFSRKKKWDRMAKIHTLDNIFDLK